jgi:hypothetical protein
VRRRGCVMADRGAQKPQRATRGTLMRVMTGLIALPLAIGCAEPAWSQTATVLSQTQSCQVRDRDTPNPSALCRFAVLIVDPASDRRISCDFAMTLRYQRKQAPPRLVNPVIDPGISPTGCFIQPGLGMPHPSITDISSRTKGKVLGSVDIDLSPNAYIIYMPNKITFCMNAGSLLGLASETACRDAEIQPF